MKRTFLRQFALLAMLIGIASTSTFAQIEYHCYPVPVNGNETILIQNGVLYRLTIKSCWMSSATQMGTYLIYGLDHTGNSAPSVLTTAETPSIDWTFSYSNTGSYDFNMTITSNGWGDQGLSIAVEKFTCPALDIGEINPPINPPKLAQNYPNPFNQDTKIEYSIQTTTDVQLRIFDSSGNLITIIVNETKKPGEYIVEWNGQDEKGILVKSGTYFYQLQTKEFISSKKMIILK